MYGRRSNSTRKPRRARRSRRSARRPGRRMRKTIAPMETACIKESLTLGDITPNTPYEPQLSLNQFPRAADLADNYQQYRISKIEYIYTPKYDTFGALYSPSTSNVQVTLPYLYTKKQTGPTPLAWTLDFLTKQGAKPIRLDDKTITHRYRPHILQTAANTNLSSPTNTQRPIKSPWLATHNFATGGSEQLDETIHYTHNFWVNQEITNPASASPLTLECNVYFEFKKPWDNTSSPPGAPQKVNPFARDV